MRRNPASDHLGSSPTTTPTLITSAAAILGAVLAGCSAAPSQPAPESPPTPVTSVSTSATRAALNSRAQAAEQVQQALGARITLDEERYGSGTGSPCSTSSATLFTARCGQVAAAVDTDAALALSAIKGRVGFATLSRTARALLVDARSYRNLGCDGNPAADATRHACLAPSAALAQAFPDLRDGINLALRGQ
ncbi:hypothetical protein [Streptacidiphilus jiangxiensis]|uniref:Uncharacterized protein n=1 Tax=Streptacidiphilus jiangxiensis TaxID=235985 RepID=A0A1H7QRA3_STRJI|nr:hypothetical protein [Streptacidiphilus jiangxiensis]SEL50264.1 hypothetical protein SAMN05414137_109162 [Streptacidiphilus jiangxiensis]